MKCEQGAVMDNDDIDETAEAVEWTDAERKEHYAKVLFAMARRWFAAQRPLNMTEKDWVKANIHGGKHEPRTSEEALLRHIAFALMAAVRAGEARYQGPRHPRSRRELQRGIDDARRRAESASDAAVKRALEEERVCEEWMIVGDRLLTLSEADWQEYRRAFQANGGLVELERKLREAKAEEKKAIMAERRAKQREFFIVRKRQAAEWAAQVKEMRRLQAVERKQFRNQLNENRSSALHRVDIETQTGSIREHYVGALGWPLCDRDKKGVRRDASGAAIVCSVCRQQATKHSCVFASS